MAEIPNELTLNFTAIEEIYRAGVKRGQDEATSFEWGSGPSGSYYQELVDALYEIFNEGLKLEDPNTRQYDNVKVWVEARMAERIAAPKAMRLRSRLSLKGNSPAPKGIAQPAQPTPQTLPRGW